MEATLTPMQDIIAERLKSCMNTRNISAIELAKKAGVKPSFIYDIINGKSANPSTVRLTQVANVLGVSLAWLAGQDGESDTASAAGSSPYVTISTLKVRDGSIVTTEIEGEPYYFHRAWICDRLGVKPHDLRMLFVEGDSMEPTLCQGDMLLIDMTKNSPYPPGNFVLFDGTGLLVKRLEPAGEPSGDYVRIISDNKQYETTRRSLDDIRIVGRVIWFAREM